MTDMEKMTYEMSRARELMAEAIAALQAENGDIRFFSAAILTAAVQLLVEVEGTAGLERAIAKIAEREMIRSGEAGKC